MTSTGKIVFWSALCAVLMGTFYEAATSPLLAWRQPVYIVAGFAGIAAMVFLLCQPLLIEGYVPDLPNAQARKIHRWFGGGLVLAIVLHVAGLWITSPPDVVDALLFRSPTPFSVWGMLAMWAIFAAACVAVLRRRVGPRLWRVLHMILVTIAVGGSVLHAMRIEGTMGMTSKVILCGLVLGALIKTLVDFRGWRVMPRRRS